MVLPYPEELMMNSDWIMAATGNARVGARKRDNQEGKVQEQKRSGTSNASAVNPLPHCSCQEKRGCKSAAAPESPGAAGAGLARAEACGRAVVGQRL